MVTNDSLVYPTMMSGRLSDGRIIGVDRSVHLVRSVPMSPVADAKSATDILRAGTPIASAMEGLASLPNVRGDRRSLVRSQYRQAQLLLINVPTLFKPTGPNAAYLREMFPEAIVDRRILLLAVKLQSTIGDGGLRAAINSVSETLVSGGTPMSDYDKDFREVSEALSRAGLRETTGAEMRLANAWWNQGLFPDTVMLNHPDHMHVFADASSAAAAESYGLSSCESWPDLSSHHIITLAAAQDFDLPYVEASQPAAQWVSPLVEAGALAVSVRFSVEPSKVTRGEVRRQRRGYIDDMNDAMKNNKMDRAEHEERLQELQDVEGVYSSGGAPATLVDTSVVVGFDGLVEDMTDVETPQVSLSSMLHRQPNALAETMLASSVRANPNLHDLPASALAFSGMPSLSTVGDKEGALVGFTEHDRQPALLSPTAVSASDAYPLAVVAGSTGSGKSMLMLWLADQIARMGRPVVIIDPKEGSDHSQAVQSSGGQVASLDDLMSADGILDPLRFSATREVGVELAASVLLTINPWGDAKSNYEVPLISALSYGVDQGATCTGQALQLALDAGKAHRAMVESVFALAEASPMFRALFGVDPSSQGLRLANGITLIKVGSAHLDLPKPSTPPDQTNMFQRIALSVVRMMLFGSAMALTGRDGVIFQDEAWTILNADPGEVERLGRLARSQRVLPVLLSQDISGAIRAGLKGYISRGFIGPIGDEVEARAACSLFQVEDTAERIERITARGTMGSVDEETAPNWLSMKALRDPDTREVLRGSVWLYSDLSGRVVPVEARIPGGFLSMASTTSTDLDRRAAESKQAPV